MLRMAGLSLALIALITQVSCVVAGNSMEVFLTNSTVPEGADEFKVAISEVSFNVDPNTGEEDEWIVLPLESMFDVLTLQNDVKQLLGTVGLPPAVYRQVRVRIASATIKVGTEEFNVVIPNRVVQLPITVGILAEKHFGIVLDFNGQASVTRDGNTWTMSDPLAITLKEVYRINDAGVNVPIPQEI